jgi:putative sigma-54 modulation protein
MKISITARKFKAHDSLKDFITSEVSSLEKFNDSIMGTEVVLSYVNNKEGVKSTEIILQVPGQTLKASESTDDFKKSTAAAVEKISRQLEKIKNKKTSRVKPTLIENDQD